MSTYAYVTGERVGENGEWEYVYLDQKDFKSLTNQCYFMYAFLSDVRNYSNLARVVSTHKLAKRSQECRDEILVHYGVGQGGYPSYEDYIYEDHAKYDISLAARRDLDTHGFTSHFLMLDELIAFDYNQKVKLNTEFSEFLNRYPECYRDVSGTSYVDNLPNGFHSDLLHIKYELGVDRIFIQYD